jgi:hypothetical protein
LATNFGLAYLVPSTEKEIEFYNVLIKLKTELSGINQSYVQSRLDFLDTLGIELDTEFNIIGELTPVIKEYDLSKMTVWAFQYRPEPKQTQLQEEMDSLGVKLSMATRYPTISLGAHYEYAGEELKFADKNWNATLNLNLPLFDGWQSLSRFRQKDIQVQQNKLHRKELEDVIRLELRKSINEYNYWTKQVTKNYSELTKWESVYDSINKTDPVVLLNWYKTCLNLKLVYLEAIYNTLSSYSMLERSVGKPLE